MAKGAVGSDIFWNEIINRRLIFEDAKTDPSCFTDFDQRFEKEFEKTFGDCCLDSSALLNDAKSLPSYEYKPFLNPYLSEVAVAIPDYTQHAYFFEGCKSSFQNVRQSIADDINRAIEEEQEKERKKKERKKSKPPALTFDHDGVKLNQQEEMFYQALVEALDGLIEEKDIELHPGHLHIWFSHKGIDTIGGIKLQGRKFRITVSKMMEVDGIPENDSNWIDVSGAEDAIRYIPNWIRYIEYNKERGWWYSFRNGKK
jgi:hypothetical protein